MEIKKKIKKEKKRREKSLSKELCSVYSTEIHSLTMEVVSQSRNLKTGFKAIPPRTESPQENELYFLEQRFGFRTRDPLSEATSQLINKLKPTRPTAKKNMHI